MKTPRPIQALLFAVFTLWLTACGSSTPQPVVTPTAPPQPVDTPALTAASSSASIDPAQGGSVALDTGAELTFPPESVSATTKVTFRSVASPFAVPIPRSQIGAGYAVETSGGEMTGVALLRLPLPPGVTPDAYELAPYRWTGSTWERITSRADQGYLEFGISQGGDFSIQGRWRFADAALGLVKADEVPGQESIPLTVVGQYRFSALPAMQTEYVAARLILKQDTSGGAGRASGVETLDASIEEAPLLFKPDPSSPRGLIEFNHIFDLHSDLLDLMPGGSTRFYAVLAVDDSAAPTRRVSGGVEYTHILSIKLLDGNIVRPKLANEGRYNLRWNATLNGAAFHQEQAVSDRLAFQPLIDRGGLGDYRVVLEVEQEGAWITISNQVSVQLALRPSATPEPGQEPTRAPIAAVVSTPTAEPAVPGQIPVPPTRRPTPAAPVVAFTPTVAVVAAGSPTSTAEPTRINGTRAFWADQATLAAGDCANLNWQVENVLAVYLDGSPVTGSESRSVCPIRTTTYTLRVQTATGFQDRGVTITVTSASTPQPGAIEFSADVYQIAPGGCAILRWRAVNVRAVYLNNQGVAGEASQQVCPQTTTVYTLRVEDISGQSTTRSLTIAISPLASGTTQRFWAEQYTLPANACTTLHWKVLDVREVFLDGQGVAGEGNSQACPGGIQFYTLRIVGSDGAESYREITLMAGDPGLSPNEVILHGIVTVVSKPPDIDPNLPGDQRGYVLSIDGLSAIFVGANGFSQPAVTLRVPEDAANYGLNGPIDWPIRSGQQVEFRSACDGNVCYIDLQTSAFLFLRSE